MFNVLKIWIEKHFFDFRDNLALIDRVLIFANGTMTDTGFEKSAAHLKRSIQLQVSKCFVLYRDQETPCAHYSLRIA